MSGRAPALVAMTCAAMAVAAPALAHAQPPLRLDPRDAHAHAGETAIVCGQVAQTYCNVERGLRLTLATPPGTPPVYVRIALADRAKFGPRPENQLFRQHVCVAGPIETRRVAAVVTIADPSALTVERGGPPLTAFGAGAAEPCDVPTAVMPRVTHEEKAEYPKKLRGRGIAGQVWLQAVVETSGRVGDVRVTQSLDPDLDAQAIRALKRWTFAPATVDGRPIAVIATVQIGFRLRP